MTLQWDGRAQAMELVIGALMANYCCDPERPTKDEMRLVSAEVVAILKAVPRQSTE